MSPRTPTVTTIGRFLFQRSSGARAPNKIPADGGSNFTHLQTELASTLQKIKGIDPGVRKKRFNNLFVYQPLTDYCACLSVGGEGRRRQRLDSAEGQNDPFLNPDSSPSAQSDALNELLHPVLSKFGKGIAFLFGPRDHEAYMADSDARNFYKTTGIFLQHLESVLRTISGNFFSVIFKGTVGAIEGMKKELDETPMSDRLRERYLKRILAQADDELAFQEARIGMIRYYLRHLKFKMGTMLRPRRESLLARVAGSIKSTALGLVPKFMRWWERDGSVSETKVKRRNPITLLKDAGARLADPAPYLNETEMAAWQKQRSEGASTLSARKRRLSRWIGVKGLALYGVKAADRPAYIAKHNSARSADKGMAKATSLAAVPFEAINAAALPQGSGAAMLGASMAIAAMHVYDVRVAISAAHTYPAQIFEILAGDKPENGMLRVLMKGSGSEVGKGMMALYSLCMGAAVITSMIIVSGDVTTFSSLKDGLYQSKENMPLLLQIPITAMFVVGAGIMLAFNDGPKLIAAWRNILIKPFTGGYAATTPNQLGDVASLISAHLGVAASAVSGFAFWYYSHMIGLGLGYYLSSISAFLDFAQTKFERGMISRAAQKEAAKLSAAG